MKMITDLQDDVVTPNVMQLGDGPLTDIGVEPGSVLRDDWDGVSDAITMQAQSAEKARKMQQLVDVAYAKAGDKEAAKRVESDALLGWALTAEAAADAENTEDVLGTQLARRYGTGDPGAVWDAMNASADYEYEQMPAWNTRAEGMRLVWQRFQKMAAGKKAEADAKQQAINERLKGLNDFVDGKEGGEDALTSGELWGMVNQGVLELEAVQRAERIREFMKAYVRPLEKVAEMDERMRALDGLRDEVYELIGEDKDTAAAFYESMMRWAGELRDKDDIGVGDEFQVAVGKKFSDWSRAVDVVAPLALLSVGAPGHVAPALVEQAVGTYEARRDKNERERLSAGILLAGIEEVMKLPEGSGVWGSLWTGVKNAPRLAARMAGETAPYFVPVVGAGLGTADAFVRGFTSGIDSKVLDYELGGNKGGWESRKAMGNAALVESGIQSLVELMPWSSLGGEGVSKWIGKKMQAATAGRYVPGSLTRAVARGTQSCVTRAMFAEGVGNVLTEGLLEPVAQGALTLTAEGVMDLAGVEHGQSKSFSEAFAELGEIWAPEQLAGFLLFSAALTAPAYWQSKENARLYKANAEKFAKRVESWELLGLDKKAAEEAVSADDALLRGRELVAEGWKNDPEGMRERMLAKNEELKESGRTLVFAGVRGRSDFDADTVKMLGEAWRLGQDKYKLPEVELLGDGKVKVSRKEIPGVVEGIDLTLTEEQADAFLFGELAKLDAARLKDWQERSGNKDDFEAIQTRLVDLVDRAMGDVAVDAAVAEGSMDVEAMGKGLPEDLQALIKDAGGITVAVARKISEWAAGRVDELIENGMSAFDARAVSASDGGATLGELMGLGAGFAKRVRDAGMDERVARSSLNRRRGSRAVQYNGRSVLGSVLLHARGGATGANAVEDVAESVFDMMVQERAQVILENQAAAREAAGEAKRPATLTEAREAEEQAWAELADVARKAREALLKVDKDVFIENVDGSRLNTIEALSTMALSRYIGSSVLPEWMNGLQKVMRGTVAAANAVRKLQDAMVALGEKNPAELKDLLEFLDDAGVQVGKSLAGARADAVVERMREIERWNAGAAAHGPGGAGGMSVSRAQEEVLAEEDEIQQNDKAREAVAESKPEDAAVRENEEDVRELEDNSARESVPEHLKGVFVGDSAVYNAAGDYWCGQIEKGKLSDGTEQVKVGEKGKHGVIAGKELTGRFVNDTAPILVWRRKDGALQVISGRHRFAKLMEDESATGLMCYVYEETEERDEKWARMKDYEQNMRDDQADEVTCAVYARETGLTEAEMRERGLTRNGSRSKRGIFIGQHAREELWTRFRNGEIKPMDAELVCKLTAALADQSQVAEIQAHCCGLLKAGKSWDYIGASVQLMASSQAQQAEQMLLDLGADFTANLERMARWVELCRKAFREAIDLLKDEKRRVKKGAKASRLGLSATMTEEKREEMLGDLEAMDAKFEMIGSYPELVAEAKMWDGDESKFADPVAMYLERVEAMQAEGLQEEQDRKAAEEATGMFNWSSSLTHVPLYHEILDTFEQHIAKNGSVVWVSRKEKSGLMVICPYPDVLNLIVPWGNNVVAKRDVIQKLMNKHSLLPQDVAKLPYALWNPVAVFEDPDADKGFIVITDILAPNFSPKRKTRKNKEAKARQMKQVMAVLELRANGNNAVITDMVSAYSADSTDKYKALLKDGYLRYVDRERALMWASAEGDSVLQLRTTALLHSGSGIMLKENLPNVNTNFSASLTGGKNLAAVHSIPVDTMLDVEKKLGGLPKPSIAITRLDKPYSWGYSERVYLIGKPELADPQKGNLVYDRDAWTGKGPFLLEDGGAYDYRKGEYFEPTLEEFVARTIKKKGQEDGSSFRGQSAVAIGTMDAVKAHRENLSDTDTSNAQKAETDEALEELIENVVKLSKKGLNEDAVAMVLARVCWRSSPMNHGAPSEMKTSRDTAKRILNELGVRVKDIKKPLVDSFMKAVAGLQNELEDYLESVPQRAVMFNEWEYAVMPESMKGTPGLDEMLERNGIKPLWHDGTEEGRRAALAGLVDDPVVSFSVIGQKAKTWDRYKERAFKGRDDGMLRAEIDASQAKLKFGVLRGKNVAAYRQIIADWDTLPKDERQIVESFAELCWERDEASKLLNEAGEGEFPEVYRKARKLADEVDGKRSEVREVIGRFFQQKGADGSVAISVKDEIIDAMSTDFWSEWGSDKVEDVLKSDPLAFGMELRDVLDFPELYEAYPQLGDVRVYTEDLKGYKGMVSNNGWSDYIMMNRSLLDNWEQFHSTLLHEVQHVIQRIEGFAKGGNKEHVRRQVKELLKGTEARMEFLKRDLRWFSAVDIARDFLKEARRLRRYPNAWKRSGQRFRFARMSSSAEEIREEILRDIAARYEEFRREDTGETLLLEMEDSLLPVVQFSSLESIEAGLAALEKIKSRKLAFRGTAAKKNRRLADLQKRYNGIKRVLAEFEYEPYELYVRLAGEIEARNVQARLNWTAEQRAARPFNETLEYPGEALVTYSLTGAGAAGQRALEESGDEYVANRLREAWQKNLEKWSVLNAGKADANSAMRAVMEMEGLVKATYDVVQDDVKLGRLYMLQRWAMVYARMVESGELPPKGALKGPAYEKFVERLTAEQRTEMRRGMSREQAEQMVKELGVERLEVAMEKVARECLRAAERHLKQKETQRVKRLLEAAWPKREEGKKAPRGKLAAREYRRLEWIAKVMELSAEDKYKETQRIIREIDELPQELVGYEERKAELEAKIAALDPAAADYVERKVELDKAMRELNPNEVGYDEAKAELEDQLNWLHVFGDWEDMDVSQARKAAKSLEDLILRGYTDWELKVQRERERTRRVADEISSHFKTPWYATRMERKADADAMGTSKPKMLKGLRWGLMGYAQMMLALRKKLGKIFCDRQRKTLAEAHRNLLQAQKDLQDWSAMELQKITGLTGAALEQWVASNNQNVNTGIMMKQVRNEKIVLSAKLVDKLELMSAAQREEWRMQELAKAEADGRAIVLPTDMEVHEMAALRRAHPGRKKLAIERMEDASVELVATKEAMLYAVLLFEQPDYEHLVEAHGLSWADVDTMKKLIGPKLLRWGYAMRRQLNENGELLAAKYEEWNGTPFGRRANYFRGVFDVNKLKPETDIIDGNAGANSLGGSKYSILIPRRYHRQQINWQMGASQVFMLTMNEQNNYIHTQHITREWRQLLSRKGFADGLSAEIGANAVNMIKLHLDVIDAAPRADAAMTSLFGRLVQGVMKATAISSLALNVYSYMKQASCLLNAVVGGQVPDSVVKQSGVYQVLTYSGIGAGELVRSYARVLSGRGAVSFNEMTGSAVIQSRIQSGGKRVADALMLRTGQALPNAVGRAGEVAGEWALEQMDMIDRKANTVAAMVVADAVYRKLSATEGGKEAGDKWVRAQAVEAAGLMVDLVAQPKLRTQKGLWASHGGFFGGVGNFFYMFRSESLAKIGTYLAQMTSGDYAKAFAGFMSMGVGLWFVNLLCSFLKGQIDGDDLDDEEGVLQFARKSAAEIIFGDLASLPIVGGGIGAAKAWAGGTWHYVQDPLQMFLPVSDLWKRPTQLYKAVESDGIVSFKAMRALCNCLRVAGNVSGWGLGTGSAAMSSACGIILGAAVVGNAGRFGLDVAERVTEE